MTAQFSAPLAYRRRRTRVVRVGDLGVGGDEPIRVQSMLTCSTWDVERVVAETRGLVEAGCEIVRVTVPTQKDLDALPAIRLRLREERIAVPLVADIHFNPRLALGCVPHVEKVRINPGNYVDAKRFEVREYSEAQYQAELDRIEETLLPLIRALQRYGRSLRIGVNHGSLSDRIMNRHGDTPQGMVECAMEYLRVLARHGYHDTVVSMKSSNPLVVIQAYRQLVLAMEREGMDYPLHLGVTEAGDGADGRIKSAIGIGALLCDGLGDTVRVSLTEPSVNEIPAARELVAAVREVERGPSWPEVVFRTPVEIARRSTRRLRLAGGDVGGDVRVAFLARNATGLRMPGETELFDGELVPASLTDRAPASGSPANESPVGSARASSVKAMRPGQARLWTLAELGGELPEGPCAIGIGTGDVDGAALSELLLGAGARHPGVLFVVDGASPLMPVRYLANLLDRSGLDWPIAVLLPDASPARPPLAAAAQIGSLAADGLLDALVAPGADPRSPGTELCKTLLQAARLRTYKTEYISCPSCGRTLFDLQETTERIKARTSHLKGVKIAVMGCVVNGPGEMADADFGYVGGAPGKVNLYKGKTCVERGIPTELAVERLVHLIREHGAWVDPA
jgi:(E)-4-hydroxy-3-methylbut-2-enyl-diphosphate synthase